MRTKRQFEVLATDCDGSARRGRTCAWVPFRQPSRGRKQSRAVADRWRLGCSRSMWSVPRSRGTLRPRPLEEKWIVKPGGTEPGIAARMDVP